MRQSAGDHFIKFLLFASNAQMAFDEVVYATIQSWLSAIRRREQQQRERERVGTWMWWQLNTPQWNFCRFRLFFRLESFIFHSQRDPKAIRFSFIWLISLWDFPLIRIYIFCCCRSPGSFLLGCRSVSFLFLMSFIFTRTLFVRLFEYSSGLIHRQYKSTTV